jgi:hypothetical protein
MTENYEPLVGSGKLNQKRCGSIKGKGRSRVENQGERFLQRRP